MEGLLGFLIIVVVIFFAIKIPTFIGERTGIKDKSEFKFYRKLIDYFQSYNPKLKVTKITDGFNSILTMSDGFSKVTIERDRGINLFIKFHKYDRKTGTKIFSWDFLELMSQDDVISEIKKTISSNSNPEIPIALISQIMKNLSNEFHIVEGCYSEFILISGGYQFLYTYKDYRGVNKFYIKLIAKPRNYEVLYFLDDFKTVYKKKTWECSFDEDYLNVSQKVKSYIHEDIKSVVLKK